MNDKLPMLLQEAQMTLWLADAAGSPSGDPIFYGGFCNHLSLQMEYEGVVIKASGARYGRQYHADENHHLDFGQTWLVSRSTLEDFKPARNTQYVLQLLWTAGRQWLRRIYFGVTWQHILWQAPTPNQFLCRQSLRAQYFTADSGTITTPPPVIPPAPVPSVLQPVPFSRESPLIPGEYLLGFYQWNDTVTVSRLDVIYWPSQTQDTVLGLEVGGVLTGHTLTLPAGTANVEATQSQTVSFTIPPNSLVRWKILSGPDAVDAAWSVALTMLISGT